MAENSPKKNTAPDNARVDSRMTKLFRAGERVLARQLNLRKPRTQR